MEPIGAAAGATEPEDYGMGRRRACDGRRILGKVVTAREAVAEFTVRAVGERETVLAINGKVVAEHETLPKFATKSLQRLRFSQN